MSIQGEGDIPSWEEFEDRAKRVLWQCSRPNREFYREAWGKIEQQVEWLYLFWDRRLFRDYKRGGYEGGVYVAPPIKWKTILTLKIRRYCTGAATEVWHPPQGYQQGGK